MSYRDTRAIGIQKNQYFGHFFRKGIVMKYQNEITTIIKDIINLTEPIEDISIDTNLQNIGMDSITFVRVVVEIENKFRIEFPDDKLIITEAGTINQLCVIVQSVKGPK